MDGLVSMLRELAGLAEVELAGGTVAARGVRVGARLELALRLSVTVDDAARTAIAFAFRCRAAADAHGGGGVRGTFRVHRAAQGALSLGEAFEELTMDAFGRVLRLSFECECECR